jgi:hypothetical protein
VFVIATGPPFGVSASERAKPPARLSVVLLPGTSLPPWAIAN